MFWTRIAVPISNEDKDYTTGNMDSKWSYLLESRVKDQTEIVNHLRYLKRFN